jgi:hypothetical protein
LVLTTGCTAATDDPTTVGEGATTKPTQVENDSNETTGEEAVVTLSDAGCAYQGPSSMAVGRLSVEMSNQTNGQFDLDLWLLEEGHQYEELAGHIDDERARDEAGKPSLGHPTFATLVAERSTEGEPSGQITTDLAAGTYGMACIFFDRPGSLGGLWPVGPLVITR